ncbi:MAG TPA: ABC transporter substrate-binding protein [Phototrophicaceae bacterium]|nr:ABC transporter substrate-binding protein [Phototrophicaceae bacterium]
MRKIALLLVLMLLAVHVVAAQESTPAATTAVADPGATPFACPTTGGTMVTQGNGDPESLNGLYANDGNSLAVTTFMDEPLVLGGENWGDQTQPALAQSWDVSPDGLTYTFHLRQGVKWSDGQPFTSADVIFTFDAVLEDDNTIDWKTNLMQGDKPIGYKAIDDNTVQVTLSAPDPAILNQMSIPIVPKHGFASTHIKDAPFNSAPITTGPFKFVKWETGQDVQLEANKDYWGGAPCLDRIVVRFISGAQNVANALQSGDVDFAEVDGADLSVFDNNADYVVAKEPRDLVRLIGFNTKSKTVGDPAVRRALITGLDRQAIIDAAVGGNGTISDSLFNQSASSYQAGLNTQYPFDPDQAKQMLADAGWKDSDGNGFLDKDGQELTLKLEYSASWALMGLIAPIVYDNWKALGVNITLDAVDDATGNTDIYDNTSTDKPYDAFLSGWGLFGTDPSHYQDFYANDTSYLAYDNPDVTKLFDAGNTETDPAKRTAIYQQADKLLWQDLPMIPIFQPIGVYAYTSNLNLDAAEINGTFLTGLKYPARAYFVNPPQS